MEKKYFQKEGLIAFKLWAFELLIDALEVDRQLEKIEQLYDKVVQFSQSIWMETKATAEERKDMQNLVDRLTIMRLGA
ncbi:MAG: hypothetical protein IJ864_00620 [Alphaproteobacteria bacterium]|nr:hypothetical protein [Alphaproteobacteria bacterium]